MKVCEAEGVCEKVPGMSDEVDAVYVDEESDKLGAV